MQKAKAQQNQAQMQLVAVQGRGMAIKPPQGEQISPLEALIDEHSQTERLSRFAAMANNNPAYVTGCKALPTG
jgi:hypothetical protein